ncbi:hypothetical protein [Actinomadura violacea]|uniref:Uncharacterized protein n=1 Tax=Actinomadura violacea TaxID=2819934 RepID=A0ABS3S7F4_9ACTN|nr:hypothetical protein [Actinomadura violacea]MBO2464938.1 hypothetical protein [Actinomadura violacea]
MASTQQIKRAVERRRRRTWMLFIAVGLLVVVLLVSLLLGGTGSGDKATPKPTAPAPGTGAPAPGSTVTLPQAGQVIDQKFPVRFPHTPAGAAAAMAAMLSSTWTMDAVSNAQAADVYAQPQIRSVARQAGAPAAAGLRQRVGLPVGGKLPEGAYVSLTPTGVRWKVLGPDRVQVAMMVNVSSAASTQNPPDNWVHTIGSGWVWDSSVRGGDWVFTGDDVDAMVPDIATPGTPQFTKLGWLAIAS